MIALVVFLLCGLAGASAFIMASSNAGRHSHSDEQQYYTVSSAALMVVDLLDGLTYTSQEVSYDYERKWNYADGAHTDSDSYKLTVPQLAPSGDAGKGTVSGAAVCESGSSLKLADTIASQCDKIVPFAYVPDKWYLSVREQAGAPVKPESVAPISYVFTIRVEDGTGGAQFDTVQCRLVMTANCDLSLTFRGEGDEYSMTAYWTADVKPVQTTGEPQYEYADGGAVVNGEYTNGSMTQHGTLRVIVTWTQDRVTISRGEAITNE